jgi:hypothetical protein
MRNLITNNILYISPGVYPFWIAAFAGMIKGAGTTLCRVYSKNL